MWKLLQVVVDCFLLCFLMFPVSYPLFHGLTVDGLSKLYATANVFGSTKKPLRDLTSQQARQKKSPDPDQPDSKCLLSHLTCAICTVWGPSCYRCLLVFSTNVSNYDSTFVKRRVKLFSLHMINVYQCHKETTKFGPVLVKKIKPNGVWLFRCSPLDSAGCTLNSTTVTEIGDMLHTFVRKRHANSAMHWTAINMSTWPTWYIN